MKMLVAALLTSSALVAFLVQIIEPGQDVTDMFKVEGPCRLEAMQRIEVQPNGEMIYSDKESAIKVISTDGSVEPHDCRVDGQGRQFRYRPLADLLPGARRGR